MYTVEITDVGNSLGIVFPQELLEKMRVGKGDVTHVLETPKGLQISPYDAEFEKELEAAELVMQRRSNVLRKLAE